MNKKSRDFDILTNVLRKNLNENKFYQILSVVSVLSTFITEKDRKIWLG